MIYGVQTTKSKVLSTSLGSHSAKYLPSHSKIVNNSAHISSSQSSSKAVIEKPELTKKYSHEKIRTNTAYTTTYTKVANEASYDKKY